MSTKFDDLRIAGHLLLGEAALQPNVHDVRRAFVRAAVALSGLDPTVVRGLADADDLRAMMKDLELVAKVIDPVIEAIGRQAKEHAQIDLDLFREQLARALEGCALFELESAAEDYEADEREAAYERMGV